MSPKAGKVQTKGSKQAAEDILSIGKTYLDECKLDKVVKAFEDATSSYRISAFRNAGRRSN